MILNNSVKYALLGLIYLVHHSDRKIKIIEIAEKENIPVAFLRKVFQKLSKANIVKATLGPQGGFMLNKKAQDIKLIDVIFAIEAAEIKKCKKLVSKDIRNHYDGKQILKILSKIYDNHINFMSSINLKQIIQ